MEEHHNLAGCGNLGFAVVSKIDCETAFAGRTVGLDQVGSTVDFDPAGGTVEFGFVAHSVAYALAVHPMHSALPHSDGKDCYLSAVAEALEEGCKSRDQPSQKTRTALCIVVMESE